MEPETKEPTKEQKLAILLQFASELAMRALRAGWTCERRASYKLVRVPWHVETRP